MAGNEGPPLLGWLATLSDLARVRVLRLLDQQELSVGELALALQLPQSTVSRHLKQLLDQHLVMKRSEGTASLYRLATADLNPAAHDLWMLLRNRLGPSTTFTHDDARLQQVLAERRTDSRSFFGRIAGEWDELRGELFGELFTLESLLSLIDPEWIVADLGCGTCNGAELIAPLVKQVIAIDREPAMLQAAQTRLGRAGIRNVDFHQGELTAIPIDDNSLDAALIILVLHHLPEPALAIAETARVLRPGGVALIVDMVQHDRESYGHTMGHRHLGFSESDVRAWAEKAGLVLQRFQRLTPDTSAKGPSLFAARLRKESGSR